MSTGGILGGARAFGARMGALPPAAAKAFAERTVEDWVEHLPPPATEAESESWTAMADGRVKTADVVAFPRERSC